MKVKFNMDLFAYLGAPGFVKTALYASKTDDEGTEDDFSFEDMIEQEFDMHLYPDGTYKWDDISYMEKHADAMEEAAKLIREKLKNIKKST